VTDGGEVRHIVIGTPWVSAFMPTPWVDAALNLRAPSGVRVEWFRAQGWCDARRVHNVIEHALDVDADLVAFLEADVIVPPHWLESMAKHLDSGHRAVASVVPMRGRAHEKFCPFEPMAWTVEDGRLVQIDPDLGIQEIAFASLGGCLFDTDVFREVLPPWGGHEFDPVTFEPTGSTTDSILFRQLRRAGIRVYADPDIEVKHLHAFEIDRTYGDRFPDWEAGPA